MTLLTPLAGAVAYWTEYMAQNEDLNISKEKKNYYLFTQITGTDLITTPYLKLLWV